MEKINIVIYEDVLKKMSKLESKKWLDLVKEIKRRQMILIMRKDRNAYDVEMYLSGEKVFECSLDKSYPSYPVVGNPHMTRLISELSIYFSSTKTF